MFVQFPLGGLSVQSPVVLDVKAHLQRRRDLGIWEVVARSGIQGEGLDSPDISQLRHNLFVITLSRSHGVPPLMRDSDPLRREIIPRNRITSQVPSVTQPSPFELTTQR